MSHQVEHRTAVDSFDGRAIVTRACSMQDVYVVQTCACVVVSDGILPVIQILTAFLALGDLSHATKLQKVNFGDDKRT